MVTLSCGIDFSLKFNGEKIPVELPRDYITNNRSASPEQRSACHRNAGRHKTGTSVGITPESRSAWAGIRTNSTTYTVPFDSPLSTLLNEACFWEIQKTITDEFLRSCIIESLHDLLRSENHKRTRTIGETIIALQQTPSSYYHSWIYNWLLGDYNAIQQLTSDDFIIALLCIPFGKGNKPLAFDREFKNYILNKGLINYLEEPKSSDPTFFSFSTFLWIISIAFDASIEIDGKCYTIMAKLISNANKYRVEYLSGIFPFQPSDLELTWHINNVLSEEDNDLLLLLSSSKIEETDLLDLLPDKNMTHHELVVFYNTKQSTYLQLVSKAYKEGLYELGTSLLSLYLLYRMIFLKGRLNISPALLDTINKALILPGQKTLKFTFEIIIANVEKYYSNDPLATCSVSILKQYIPQVAELHAFEGGKGKYKGADEIRSILKSELGSDRWDKLSIVSQDLIVSAEVQWKNSYMEFGFGIKDWSGLIITYCKAIEGELLDRLSIFYLSTEYEAYLNEKGIKRQGKPTAGWLLTEFRSIKKMPLNLQEIASKTRIRLNDNADLVNRLYELFQNYRNKSAHPDAVGMKYYSEFKEKLFQKGLLLEFIDSFS